MIGLDTSVLLRYLTRDDAAKATQAAALLESRSRQAPAFISLVTLIQAVWALGTPRYGFSREDILTAIGTLASLDELKLQEAEAVRAAVAAARASGCTFTQALVAELGQAAGCCHTATFDPKAGAALPAMQSI
ncbi:MAG: hypothetical protein LBR19_05860 [Bifidobacteriaceae bacterium]|jgi:predicted nucleic-acid-binding protein|nr:hypothetical protein [Bifidobacteriaceae bacterium]